MNDPELKDRIAIMGMDNFYKGLPKGTNPDDYDFDHPKSLNMDELRVCLEELISKGEVSYSIYDFKTHGPSGQIETIKMKDIFIFEGIMSMYDEAIRDLFDVKIFVHCDPDICLARRIIRDIRERGRDANEVLKRYNRFVKIDFEKYVQPQMKYCDMIVPGGKNNDISVQMILDVIKSYSKINQHQINLSAMLRESNFKGVFDQSLSYKFNNRGRILSQKNPIYEGVFERILQNGPDGEFEKKLSFLIRKLINLGSKIIREDQQNQSDSQQQEIKRKLKTVFIPFLTNETFEELQQKLTQEDQSIQIVSILTTRQTIEKINKQFPYVVISTFQLVQNFDLFKCQLIKSGKISIQDIETQSRKSYQEYFSNQSKNQQIQETYITN